MKTIAYIKYFFYLAYNWNLSVAWHIIKQEIRGEKKYGIDSTGADELKSLIKKGIDTTHATIYMPVSYDLLERIFEQLKKSPNNPSKHFLDIGCGKGRAVCVAAHNAFTKISGIDFSKELCVAAEANIAKTKEKIPGVVSKIYNNDAFYFEIPNNTDCIFLFNPFDEVIMRGVAENIAISLDEQPRKLTIVYVNPLYKELFTENGFREVYHYKELKYLEVCILQN